MRLYRALRCCCDFISTSSHFVLVRSLSRRRRCCFFFFLLFGLLFNFFFRWFCHTSYSHMPQSAPCRRCKATHRPRLCVYFEHSKKKNTYIALLRVLSLNILNAIFVCLAIALDLMCTTHTKFVWLLCMCSCMIIYCTYIISVCHRFALFRCCAFFLCLLFHRLNYILSLYFHADCSLFESLHRFIYTYVFACASFSSFTFFSITLNMYVIIRKDSLFVKAALKCPMFISHIQSMR